MFLFHSASEVSSTGAEDAMPAFDIRMSNPPNSTEVSAKAAATWVSSVTFICTPRTTSAPCRAAKPFVTSSSAVASISASMTQAPSRRKRSAVAAPMPPAPPVTSAIRPASVLGFGIRCSLASSSSQYSMSKASCSGRP